MAARRRLSKRPIEAPKKRRSTGGASGDPGIPPGTKKVKACPACGKKRRKASTECHHCGDETAYQDCKDALVKVKQKPAAAAAPVVAGGGGRGGRGDG